MQVSEAPPALPADTPKRHSNRAIAVGFAVAAIVFAILYAGTLRFYFSDWTARDATFVPGSGGGPNHITVTASILAVDTTRNTAMVRLAFEPAGTFSGGDGVLTRSLAVSTNSIAGGRDIVLEAGRVPLPDDIVIDLAGNVSDYPFDRFTTSLDLALAEVSGGSGTTGTNRGAPVPIRLMFKDALHGLDGYPVLDSGSTDGDVELNLTIVRSRTALAFALFIMFATALVTTVVVVVASLMVLQHRKFEFGMLGWIAALLFALPAVRNVMPGVPGVGTLSDFLVLFWALGLLVAAMIWVAIIWVRHPMHQQ